MIKIVEGSLLDAKEDILVQQVNCQGVMGSGIAKQIREKYPEVYLPYKEYCNLYLPEKLLGRRLNVKVSDGKVISNLFGQLNFGTDKKHTNYEALYNSLLHLYCDVTDEKGIYYKSSVAIPKNLGSGLAGGDWQIVIKMIEVIFKDYDISIYKYDK